MSCALSEAMLRSRLVGSLKLQVSFAKEPYKRDAILQKQSLVSCLVSCQRQCSSFHSVASFEFMWVRAQSAQILCCREAQCVAVCCMEEKVDMALMYVTLHTKRSKFEILDLQIVHDVALRHACSAAENIEAHTQATHTHTRTHTHTHDTHQGSLIPPFVTCVQTNQKSKVKTTLDCIPTPDSRWFFQNLFLSPHS